MADRNEYLEDPMWYVVHTYSGYENKVKTNIDFPDKQYVLSTHTCF